MRFAAVFLLVVGCASGPKVGVDHDTKYDFTGKKTYAWDEGLPAENPLDQKWIVDGINAAMKARGFRLSSKADLVLWTEATTSRYLEPSRVSFGIGVGAGGRYGGTGVGATVTPGPTEVTVGTLVIVIVDGPSGELVWRAEAREIAGENANETAASIDTAITKAFEDFPPGSANEVR